MSPIRLQGRGSGPADLGCPRYRLTVTLQHLAANKHVEPSTPADAEPVVDADAPNFSPKPLNDQSLPQDSQPTAGIMTFGSSNTNEITPSAVEAHEAFRHEPAVAEQPPAADAYAPAATTTTTSSVADGTVSFMQSSEIQDAPVQPQQTQQMETATAASAPVLAEPVAPVPAAIEAVQVEQRVSRDSTTETSERRANIVRKLSRLWAPRRPNSIGPTTTITTACTT